MSVSWYWLGADVLVLVIGAWSRRGEAAGTAGRGSVPVAPPTPEEIDGLLRAGQKIAAIKAYRQLHGVDLKAAKDATDARARELGH
jgi:ribosomal protein L7/L12